ncbi:non-ribosomal peptide synthetase [Streptomyces zingiberis]|uniref:non-ribosomal peptide synthetase n=1 Tax=Streptomyces zingiberis TaxID=2053010 RepID=UPI001F0EFD82|nr:amino acid adenylation domain-containing protein [Streptomyces zingiberis]
MSATHAPVPRSPELSPRDSAPGIRPPLSSGQQRLWALSQTEGAETAYNEPLSFHLHGPLDRTLLARALDLLAARHEPLRTRFVPVDGEARQEIAPVAAGYPLTVEDFSGEPDPEALLAEAQRAECETPFDLNGGPLARGRLIILRDPRRTGRSPGSAESRRPEQPHHALLLTFHHAVVDGGSMEIMLRELGAFYGALLRGEADPLPPLTTSFSAHCRRQQEWAESPRAAAQADFWTRYLEDAPALLPLPTDRPRPARPSHRGGRVGVRISPEVTTALRAVAREQRCTLFAAVLTGWHLLLSRLSGESDTVVGIPVAGRRGPGAAELVGFFVNSLAHRADLSGDPTGAEALARVRASLRSALDHQDLPFERVVTAVNPRRSLSHGPLFQTMLAWGTSRKDLLDLDGVRAEPLAIEVAPAKFDLTLSLHEEDGGIGGYLDYARDLFDEDTARRHARRLTRILEQLAAGPGRSAADFDLLDEREHEELLALGSGPVTGPPETGLLELFDRQVRERPDTAAVVAGDTRLDYAALDRRANRLAHSLRARGAGPGDVVGLHCGRTVELLVGIWGILKAGAAYLPLDPGQPAGRLAVIVEEAAPRLVLSDAGTPPGDWLPLTGVEREQEREDSPGVEVRPSHLAYVIYTSGSTGRPKGVAVPHGNVVNLVENWLATYGATAGEASSAWASIGFDASVQELFVPLTTGATVHLVPERLRGDPAELMDWLRAHRVVHAWLPAAYIAWIDENPEERLRGLALRQVATGAEPLPEAALHRMRQVLPGLRICYVYGPTETTVYSITHNEPRDVDGRCPIGRPVRNTRIHLLDRRRRPVPRGVTGEVHIGGAGVAQGYLNRPDLTEERFLPDPFRPGERLYRTGDLARLLPDGNFEFVGRADDQVKLRGFRIEPGEIAAVLRELPGVSEAAVLADRGEGGEPLLVAGVARAEGPPLLPHEWRAALADRLPDYMIPALFAEFPRLPLNRSGKLDRRALLERAREASPGQVNARAPRDGVEMALYRIWRQVLLHPGIGIIDDFFAVGGTSLSAIKVAHLIQEEFGRHLPIREVLEHPTIERLAARVREGAPSRPGDSLIEFRAGGDGPGRVVCVHPAGGTAFCYLGLATALPEGIAVHGVQAPGIEPGQEPLPSVEAMAEHYLTLLRPAPEEPLVLCGLSYGGLVAHEMGRRLAAGGHRRTAVVLLDTHGTDDETRRAAFAPVGADEFREKLIRFNGMYPGIDDAQIDRYFRTYNHNRAAARDHTPRPTDAPLLLVQADAEAEDAAGAAAAEAELRRFWQDRARGGFRVERIDGGHWDVLEGERVPLIAGLITGELERLGARRPEPTTRGA